MNKINHWENELARLSQILDTLPLEKAVKWGSVVYMYQGRNVVSCGGFKHFFTLWFFNGLFLKDRYKVLISAQQGKTKSLRQWRFTSMEEMDEKMILSYVKEAIEIEKKGLKLAPSKTQAPPLPPELKAAFDRNKKLKAAFEELSPACRKEYILYVSEAKQQATRDRRVEKISNMISEGRKLNEAYQK